MKIAIITDDERTISQHFGRAMYYSVVTLDQGTIVNRERRAKMSHTHFAHAPHMEEPGQPHGFGPQAHQRHLQMADAIADCEAVLCGGMGRGAYESLKARNIKPVVTDMPLIDEAAVAYAQGTLVDLVERLH